MQGVRNGRIRGSQPREKLCKGLLVFNDRTYLQPDKLCVRSLDHAVSFKLDPRHCVGQGLHGPGFLRRNSSNRYWSSEAARKCRMLLKKPLFVARLY